MSCQRAFNVGCKSKFNLILAIRLGHFSFASSSKKVCDNSIRLHCESQKESVLLLPSLKAALLSLNHLIESFLLTILFLCIENWAKR